MAEVFEQIDGWCRPRTLCDGCEQPLDNMRASMVIFEEPDPEDNTTVTGVFHSHKLPECQDRVRAMAGHRNANGSWDEVSRHAVMRLAPIGMTPDLYKVTYESLLQEGLLIPRETASE